MLRPHRAAGGIGGSDLCPFWQRSNVETLTLLFLLVFFGYVAVLSLPEATGAAWIASFWLLARLTKDRTAIERRKLQVLGLPNRESPGGALSLVLERRGAPGALFELRIVDAVGLMGVLHIDGARVAYLEAPRRAAGRHCVPGTAHRRTRR